MKEDIIPAQILTQKCKEKQAQLLIKGKKPSIDQYYEMRKIIAEYGFSWLKEQIKPNNTINFDAIKTILDFLLERSQRFRINCQVDSMIKLAFALYSNFHCFFPSCSSSLRQLRKRFGYETVLAFRFNKDHPAFEYYAFC